MILIPHALAQNINSATGVAQEVANQFNLDLANIFGWAIGIGGLIALGRIIYGGLKYSTSMGGSAKDDAKDIIWQALIGLALLIGAYLILNTINPEILKF